MKRIASSLFILLILGCASQKRDEAQPEGTLAIDGQVMLNGQPLPGATVTLNGPMPATTAVSDAQGSYHFAKLKAGDYKVRVELEGMAPETTRLHLGRQPSTSVRTDMRLSAARESITVTAEAPGAFTNPLRSVGGSVGGNVYAVAAAPLPMTVEGVSKAQYAPITDHAFVIARDAPTTTFAIDVDTASYANVRRFLMANTLPPPDAVRIEEMVNYFPYHYPQPADSRPFSVTTEVAACPWDLTHRLLRIGIRGKTTDQWKMAPNNLVFLLDVSGSMQPPERLPLIKSAFRLLVNQLRAEDSVAIVTYAGAAGLALPRTSGADKQTILSALDRLESGGSTAGGEGIELAYKLAQDNFLRDGNNRVILATDGDFNVGITSMKALTGLIEEKRQHNIFLTVLGVGDDNLQDATMEMLADKGNGIYAYLDTMKEAQKVFGSELTGTLVTIAKDVKVQLQFDPARVASYRQIGYENRALENQDFEDDRKDAGELGSGHSVTALYEIIPVAGVSATGPLASLRLRYKDPTAESSQLVTASIVDDGRSVYAASPDLQFAAAVAEFGMLLRKSPHKGNATFAEVLALARAARGEDLDGYREEFLRMAETSRTLSGETRQAIAGR